MLNSLPERVTRRVERTSTCWLWTGALQRNGYGYTTWKINGRWGHARVHRLYYEAFAGPIPEGYEVDHICKVRACVNPDHLRAVTHAENLLTRNHRGPAQGEACKNGHPWTPENTYIDGRGRRGCRPCRTENVRRWRSRKT